jgi:hypothetical protein
VRPPLTTFAQLGQEGRNRVGMIKKIIGQVDDLMDTLDAG